MSTFPDQPNSPRHAELRAQWKPGQLWETLVQGATTWVPVSEPSWDHHQEYRQVASELSVAVRCPLCGCQHGHAIGCANNPVDIALAKACLSPNGMSNHCVLWKCHEAKTCTKEKRDA